MKFNEKVQQTKDYLLSQIDQSPSIGLVLGSGLGILADEIENPTYIPYNELPHFPASTVTGHAGRMVIGDLKGKRVIAMQGRFHYYEGHSLEAVTYPIRIMKAIGVQQIIVTNAAGGINPDFKPGDLMIIQDHINLTSQNPLIGPNEEEFGERFPDMSEAYSKKLIALAKDVASKNKINMVEGIYAGMLGPSYETPAEINFLSIIGASAVGMSTVPEVIVAQHSGLEVLGISCISNMAAGISEHSLTHDEVMETTENIKAQFLQLVKEVIAAM
ncbi:purine-nucleoside phosphorylase [Priestia aryabhattai]|uniref:purine-nucleoside phosphorylase n=1 Tax=Priestia aryabhattai TaxID=412384 RepID=UPI001874112F|nr:purine-nucleoside phosphorylase [Priestia aryabhattai]MBE5103527.1 purine-nucleoside phosphorylase [Priestia aryabhattai]